MNPLPWQSAQWAQLRTALDADGLAHALLVSGAAGIGKAWLLRALAARLLCHQPRAGFACGSCKSCRLLGAGSHSDLLLVEPEEDSRVIRIDQVRRLIEFAARTAALGERKVILLGPAEAMNINAANALLKCLEEPAPGTHLLLYGHRPAALPATIRSRCQGLSLGMPPAGESADWLAERTGDRVLAVALLAAAGGAPLTAWALREADTLAQRQALQRALGALVEGKLAAVELPPLVAELDPAQIVELFSGFLQREIREAARRGDAGLQRAFRLLDELQRLGLSISRGGNPNKQLLVEDAAIRLRDVLGSVGVSGTLGS
jgi:DNA polymerase-3 subunit delta'